MDNASKKLKKMDDATSIASLPQEIILKILTTLPPKSAVSFRCTSKFFHSFIPQPHFAFRILFWVSSTNLNTVGYTTEETHGMLQPSSLQCSADELQRFKRLRLGGSSFVCSAEGMLRVLTLGVDESWRVVTTEKSFIPRKPYASVQIDVAAKGHFAEDPLQRKGSE
nr:F-box only protein 8-like [Ipomoea trifida]